MEYNAHKQHTAFIAKIWPSRRRFTRCTMPEDPRPKVSQTRNSWQFIHQNIGDFAQIGISPAKYVCIYGIFHQHNIPK